MQQTPPMKKTVPTITVYVIALVAHSTYTVMMAHFAFLAPGGLWAGPASSSIMILITAGASWGKKLTPQAVMIPSAAAAVTFWLLYAAACALLWSGSIVSVFEILILLIAYAAEPLVAFLVCAISTSVALKLLNHNPRSPHERYR